MQAKYLRFKPSGSHHCVLVFFQLKATRPIKRRGRPRKSESVASVEPSTKKLKTERDEEQESKGDVEETDDGETG